MGCLRTHTLVSHKNVVTFSGRLPPEKVILAFLISYGHSYHLFDSLFILSLPTHYKNYISI